MRNFQSTSNLTITSRFQSYLLKRFVLDSIMKGVTDKEIANREFKEIFEDKVDQ